MMMMIIIIISRKGGNCDALQLEAALCWTGRSGLLFVKFVLRMRRNCHFRTSGQNSHITIRFSDPDFLKQSNNLAIIRCIQACFITVQIEYVPHFYFRFIWPNDLEHVSHISLNTWIIFIKFEVGQPIRSVFRIYCWYVTSHCDHDLWPLDIG